MLAAVSGGSDSSALLLLLRDHLQKRGNGPQLIAVTVDHGLRPESAAEAQTAAAFAASLGIPHRILRWEGNKPSAGLPAAAREARYRLLRQAANEAGSRMVFTGHTADDQAETVAMRLARGEGRGLAGMAPLTLFESSLWIGRPLLEARRADLRAVLRERGLGWTDDPTNTDLRFERARLRRLLAASERDGRENSDNSPASQGQGAVMSVVAPRRRRTTLVHGREASSGKTDELLLLARRAGEARRQVAEQAAGLLQAHADQPAPGLFRLSPKFPEDASRSAAIEALRMLLAAVGGKSFPVDALRAGALLDALRRPGRHTLGGTIAERRSDAVFLHRESRGIPAAGPGTVFDGRFQLSACSLPGSVGPWGGRFDAGNLPIVPDVPRALLRGAFAASPAFHPQDGGVPVALDAAAIAGTPVVAPFRDFLPSFDLALAQALAKLLGALVFPSAPYRGDGLELA